jgi:integrase
MASIFTELRGGKVQYRVQFYDKDRARKSIRLGPIGEKAAHRIADWVDQLVAHSIAGGVMDRAMQAWVSDLGADLAGKFAQAGLLPKREFATLAAFIDGYIASRKDAKPNTVKNWNAARNSLVGYFGEKRGLHTINSGEADEWRQSLVNDSYAEATISKWVKISKHFFKLAQRKKLVETNPLGELKGGSERNDARLQFIDRATIQKVIDVAPNAEWRAIIALSRYGGLRVPSELLELRWTDILWAERRMIVRSPKTAGQGKAQRLVPLFPELEKYLLEASESAPEGAVYVIHKYRDKSANLRSQLIRLAEKAGVKQWERTFHNLRASRQTELSDQFPNKVVCDWMGNSEAVARAHYLQTTEDHFQRVVGAFSDPQSSQAVDRRQQAANQTGATVGAAGVQKRVPQEFAEVWSNPQETKKALVSKGLTPSVSGGCNPLQDRRIPPRGVEPLLPD